MQKAGIPSVRCGSAAEQRPEQCSTVNGRLRPQIPINPGQRQFWRIVNASPDRYADLRVTGEKLEIVALDGMPLSYHNRHSTPLTVDHLLLPPAGRVEAIVSGPPSGANATLSTSCVDTGPDGDPNPAMVIADVGPAASDRPMHTRPTRVRLTPVYKEPSEAIHPNTSVQQADFIVTFTEDKNGFYINGQKFSVAGGPLLRVKVRIDATLANRERYKRATSIFRIHQVHFLAYAENGAPLAKPEWLDTVNVPYDNGTVDLVMDFTDPMIKGMSVFHCHLLNHEDKGMMAKILFE